MLSGENGVLPGSDYYFMTPSSFAQEIYFYPYMCGHFRCISGYDVKRDNYNNYLIMYVSQGHGAVEFENQTYDVKTGDLILLDCHKPHRYYAIDYLDIIWLHFDGHDAEVFYRQIRQVIGIVSSVSETSEVVRTIRDILLLYRNNQRLSEVECSLKIYRMLCLLISNPAESMTKSQKDNIDQAIAYIEMHFRSDIKLNDIASHINMSVFHFSRLFKKKVGHSPYHYLLILRIDQAKTLLKSTGLSVKVIARTVGFNSETNFISTFSNKVGISPQRFREFPL